MRLISGGGPGPLDGYNHGLSFEYWRRARVNATIFPEAIFVENYAAILSSSEPVLHSSVLYSRRRKTAMARADG